MNPKLELPKPSYSIWYRIWRFVKNVTRVVHGTPQMWECKTLHVRHKYVMAIYHHILEGNGLQEIANTRNDFEAWLSSIPWHASPKHTREAFLAAIEKEMPFRSEERRIGLEPIR